MECLEIGEMIDCCSFAAEMSMCIFGDTSGLYVVAGMKILGLILDIYAVNGSLSVDCNVSDNDDCFAYTGTVIYVLYNRILALILLCILKPCGGTCCGKICKCCGKEDDKPVDKNDSEYKRKSTAANLFWGASWVGLDMLSKQFIGYLENSENTSSDDDAQTDADVKTGQTDNDQTNALQKEELVECTDPVLKWCLILFFVLAFDVVIWSQTTSEMFPLASATVSGFIGQVEIVFVLLFVPTFKTTIRNNLLYRIIMSLVGLFIIGYGFSFTLLVIQSTF